MGSNLGVAKWIQELVVVRTKSHSCQETTSVPAVIAHLTGSTTSFHTSTARCPFSDFDYMSGD